MKKIRGSSLLIGKIITQELQDLIAVYPIVAPLGTMGNFAVYKRLSLTVEDTKDFYNIMEIADVAITIVSDTYEKGLELATNIKMYLEKLRGVYTTKKQEEINIEDCVMIDASEDWNNDKYLQTMVFQMKLYDNPDW